MAEVELKLAVPAAQAARVPKLKWLRELQDGEPQNERLDSVYFDTAKGKLHDHGITLRVRRDGARWLQTIKTTAAAGNGAFGRGEWEQEIKGERPDLDLAKHTPLEPLVTRKLKRKLRPLFNTRIERTRIPIRTEGAELELAIDRGHITRQGGKESEPVSEIEIELKQGKRASLPRLAARLERSLAAVYAPLSKAERGYALLGGKRIAPVRGRPIVLNKDTPAAEGFKVIGLACLDHALANERAVCAGDPEGVHQMRIGLRRLRAALSIFKALLAGPGTEAVKGELRWLTEELGTVREVDVLLKNRVGPLREHTPVAAESQALSRSLKKEREAGLARARAALASERYRVLGLNTALWLAGDAWSQGRSARAAACRRKPIARFAADILTRRSRKLLKEARRIDELDPARRHKLRIASKKLRYAAEFFASLVPGKRRRRYRHFIRILKRFQDALGTLNDIEVHKGFATRFARPRGDAHTAALKALAMGYIAGQEEKQVAACMVVIGKAGKHPLPEFWR